MRGRQRIVTDLERIGIEQQLIRIEAIAAAIDVRHKSGGGARRPLVVKEPVRSPSAIAVIDGVPDRRPRSEASIGLPVHRLAQDGISIQRIRVDPQLNACGGGGHYAKSGLGVAA